MVALSVDIKIKYPEITAMRFADYENSFFAEINQAEAIELQNEDWQKLQSDIDARLKSANDIVNYHKALPYPDLEQYLHITASARAYKNGEVIKLDRAYHEQLDVLQLLYGFDFDSGKTLIARIYDQIYPIYYDE